MNHLGKKRSKKFRALDKDQMSRFGAYRSLSCGKSQHTSKSGAKSALRQLLGDGDTDKAEKNLMTVYQCDKCGFWHVGHIRFYRRGER